MLLQKKIKIDEFSGAKVNFSLNESWERKSESEKNLTQPESEKDDLSGKFLNKTEIKESRNLYKILHKIQNNESCKNFEKFIRKYYLSKKQSYITILRKNIEELYNFNDEYLRPLSKYSIKNIYPDHPGMNCLLSGWGKHGPSENIPSDIYGQPWKLRL